jgi:hypothetical protein
LKWIAAACALLDGDPLVCQAALYILCSTAQLLVLLLTSALQFALGRRQAATAGSAQAGAPTAAHSTAAVPSSSSPASNLSTLQLGSSRSGSSSSSSAAAQSPPAASPPAAAPAAAAVKPEAAGIHEGNVARVAAMSAAEVQDAQEELEGRFSPAALAFLKARAAKKQQQQQQQQQWSVEQEIVAGAALSEVGKAVGSAAGAAAAAMAAGAAVPGIKKGFLAGKASAGSAGTPAAGAAAGAAAAPRQQPAAVGGIKKGFLFNSGARKTTQQQQQSKTSTVGDAARQSAAAHIVSQAQAAAATAAAAAASATSPSFEPLPPVARLRFSLDGQVLELADAKTPPTPDAEVLLRDNMSRAAGVVPQGYSLPEMRVLMRSGHAPQRAAGFRMLATVLRRAQPSVLHVGMDGQLLQQPVLLEELQQPQQGVDSDNLVQQQQQQQDTGVHWAQVWEYAVVALRAVPLCRLGLDDEHGQVLSAAADAAAVLLGLSPSEGLVEEVGVGVCSAAAGLSWPVSRRVSLRRLGKAGAWDRVQGLVAAVAAAQRQQPDEEVRGCILRSSVSVVAVAVASVGVSLLSAAVCMLTACCGVCWLVLYD